MLWRTSFVMSNVIATLERAQLRRWPKFQAGDRVKVRFQAVEGTRRRTQVFEGVVLKRQGSGARETFTVRKQSFGVGVERTFPVHSPKIERIEVASRGDVRRAKLYYLRGRVGRRARVRERQYTGPEAAEELLMAPAEAADAEGTQAEATPVTPEEAGADEAGDDEAGSPDAPAEEVPSDAEAKATSDEDVRGGGQAEDESASAEGADESLAESVDDAPEAAGADKPGETKVTGDGEEEGAGEDEAAGSKGS